MFNHYGYFTEKEDFVLNPQEKNKFFLKFKPLYINRVQYLGLPKKVK